MFAKVMLMITIIRVGSAAEFSENSTQLENPFDARNASRNETGLFVNKTSVETERIIKPMTLQAQSQTQRINKIANGSVAGENRLKSRQEFKPSPQLEIEYEYNKFPVAPAFPEAKHFSGGGNEPVPFPVNLPWSQDSKSTEPPWISRVRFPTQGANLHVEHPYPFYQGSGEEGQPPKIAIAKAPLKVEENSREISRPTAQDNSYRGSNQKQNFLGDLMSQWSKPSLPEKPSVSSANKHVDSAPIYQDLSVKHSLLGSSDIGEWEYAPVTTHKDTPKPKPNLSILDKPLGPLEYSASPWKKIIKFLTAAIPIGLLISALTPSVITIEDANTTSRARIEDNVESKRILKSIRGLQFPNERLCEERVLCELLLNSGSSNNAEQYVRNLLNAANNGNEKGALESTHVAGLRNVLNAVKNYNCELLQCQKTTIDST